MTGTQNIHYDRIDYLIIESIISQLNQLLYTRINYFVVNLIIGHSIQLLYEQMMYSMIELIIVRLKKNIVIISFCGRPLEKNYLTRQLV